MTAKVQDSNCITRDRVCKFQKLQRRLQNDSDNEPSEGQQSRKSKQQKMSNRVIRSCELKAANFAAVHETAQGQQQPVLAFPENVCCAPIGALL